MVASFIPHLTRRLPHIQELAIELWEPSINELQTVLLPVADDCRSLTSLRLQASEFPQGWENVLHIVVKNLIRNCGFQTFHLSTRFCLNDSPDCALGFVPALVKSLLRFQALLKRIPSVKLLLHAGNRDEDGGLWGTSHWLPREVQNGSVSLKDVGFSAGQLKDAGFNARQLKNAGFNVWNRPGAKQVSPQKCKYQKAFELMQSCSVKSPSVISQSISGVESSSSFSSVVASQPPSHLKQPILERRNGASSASSSHSSTSSSSSDSEDDDGASSNNSFWDIFDPDDI